MSIEGPPRDFNPEEEELAAAEAEGELDADEGLAEGLLEETEVILVEVIPD